MTSFFGEIRKKIWLPFIIKTIKIITKEKVINFPRKTANFIQLFSDFYGKLVIFCQKFIVFRGKIYVFCEKICKTISTASGSGHVFDKNFC